MNKIAVIGANGYIARNLISLLLKSNDAEVKLYDNADQFKDNDLYDNIFYQKVDVTDIQSVHNIDFECDIIYLFAGKTGSANGFDDYDTFINVNEKGLLNVIAEYRNQQSDAKIVFPSTRLVYKGKSGKLPEDSEKEFKTIYAINKYACEQYLEQYNRVYGVKYCIFRICIPYGTMIKDASSYGTAEFMIGKASKGDNITLYGDGSVRRTLTYMGDLCNALIKGAFCDKCVNDVFNIGGEDYSLKEMAELIASKYGVDIQYVEWPEVALKIESGDTVFDDSKMQKVCKVGYNMKFSDWCNINM